MKWSNIRDLVEASAPAVGALIAGPVGGTVGAVVATALDVLPTPEAVEEEIKNNPEALEKVKSVETVHPILLKDLALQESKMALDSLEKGPVTKEFIIPRIAKAIANIAIGALRIFLLKKRKK